MRAGFGAAAARLCAAASALLAWRPDDFWNATPAELALALQPTSGDAGSPDPQLIDELRKRFPDQ